MTDFKNWIWVEKYRPETIDDYICTDKFRKLIIDWTTSNDMHLFFESAMPGTGKSTLAKIIANSISNNILFINASMDNGIDIIRDRVTTFVSRKSLNGTKKIVILDEIDNMSINAIKSLRTLIEQHQLTSRFIVTCNNWNKVADDTTREAFLNRFSYIDFSKIHGDNPEEKKKLAMELYEFCVKILEENNIDYEPAAIALIIKRNFVRSLCFRSIIMDLQKHAVEGITIDNLVGKSIDLTELMIKARNKDFQFVREFIHKYSNNYIFILEELNKNHQIYFDVKNEGYFNLFFIMQDCLERLKGCDIPDIPLFCMFLNFSTDNLISDKL